MNHCESTHSIVVPEHQEKDKLPRVYRNSPEMNALQMAKATGFRTTKDWRRRLRRVRSNQKPAAVIVTNTDLLSDDDLQKIELLGRDPNRIYLNDDTIVTGTIPLYAHDQTRPYSPTKKTLALWRFADIFCRRTDSYIYWYKEGWKTSPPGEYLTESRIAQHVNQKEVLGVFAANTTVFLAIDLDLTSRGTGRTEHLELVRVVLDEIPEMLPELDAKCWFPQIADKQAEGLHLFFILNHPQKTIYARRQLRKCLEQIARRHPKLMQRLQDAGLKPIWLPDPDSPTINGKLAELYYDSREPTNKSEMIEMYPDFKQGFRLPLAQDRTLLLDRPLLAKKDKGDVQRVIEWIDDPTRRNMTNKAILDYYEKRLVRREEPASLREAGSPPTTHAGSLGSLKRRTWRTITGYWCGTFQPEHCLNRVLVITARIFCFEGVDQVAAEELLLDYASAIPDPVSSRILDSGKGRELERAVKDAVAVAFDNNRGQPDPELSDEKLRLSVDAWRSKGLRLSDKATWDTSYVALATMDITFDDQTRRNIETYLTPLLSSRDTKNRKPGEVALLVAKTVVNLVARKEKEGNAIDMSLFQKVLAEDCLIHVGMKQKATDIVKCLTELGLIRRIYKGNSFRGPSHYTCAYRASMHLL